jgi:hypothetical protein
MGIRIFVTGAKTPTMAIRNGEIMAAAGRRPRESYGIFSPDATGDDPTGWFRGFA